MKKILVLNPYQTSITQHISNKVSNEDSVILITADMISDTFNIKPTDTNLLFDKVMSLSEEAEKTYPKSLVMADINIFTKEQVKKLKERWNPDLTIWIDTGFDVGGEKPTFEKGEVDWRIKKATATNISYMAGMLSSIATQEDVSYVVSG